MASAESKHAMGLRLVLIALVALALLIPTFHIQSLIQERQHTRDEVLQEVSHKWGQAQTLTGPILTVPYRAISTMIRNADGTETPRYQTHYAHFLPETLTLTSDLAPEIRYRGIHEMVLYQADVQLSGTFPQPTFDPFDHAPEEILWDKAFLSLGLTDMQGINTLAFTLNDKALTVQPGIRQQGIPEQGVTLNVPLDPEAKTLTFAADVHLNGSGSLRFAPVGKETRASVRAPWANPSFAGAYLPDVREVTEEQFAANWHVLHLNRSYPQSWIGKEHLLEIRKSHFGVALLLGVDQYQKTMRTAKYAIMFIAFTFLTFFLIEVLNRKPIHPIQYLLIGLALLVFYTLLLALSEHISFNIAYWLASAGVITLITGYARSVLATRLHAALVGLTLVGLYGYLFIVLQLQSYALLIGSLGFFVVLALWMYATRKINWFHLMKAGKDTLGVAAA